MSLSAGTRLGPYEIIGPIGAGGMGEVYYGRDTKLDREVAIKILPDALAHDAERRARFDREAKVLAALNHPNVAQIYGLEENALIMELVPGQTLKGPLPLDEVLRIAGQIAHALEAAHEKGITHRDLKPRNIMITPAGMVKVLDFGLAAIAPTSEPSDLSHSPTLTMSPTHAGVILGTAAYMSPEQARGKPVDKRADIWAFGVVLYELLTGKQLFHGETVSDILAGVLVKAPDLSEVPQRTLRLLKGCLEKDPRKRLRDIGDWSQLLDDAPTPVVPSRSALGWLAWSLAGLALICGAALSFLFFRHPPTLEEPLDLSVATPPDLDMPDFIALSPDGRRIAVGLFQEGKFSLYVRSLDSAQFRRLEGTEEARMPFWSPDGRTIGFFSKGKLKTIPAAGGLSTTLCSDTGVGRGGSWNHNGTILFGSEDGVFRLVSASGGECSVVKLETKGRARLPEFLPDGKHFLYYMEGAAGDPSLAGVYRAALDDPKPHKILNDDSNALYAPPANGGAEAHLLFLRGTKLMAQPFDPQKLEAVGDPFEVSSQASESATPLQLNASVAPNGTLVYVAKNPGLSQITWFEESGKQSSKVGAPGDQTNFALSTDGNIVAVPKTIPGERGQAITLYDLARNSMTRATPHGGDVSDDILWSPQANGVVYGSLADTNLFLMDANGGGQQTPLLPSGTNRRFASDWSRDGRYLIYTEIDPKTRADIWYLPDPGKPDPKPVKFAGTDAVESQGQLSPDGRWLAYFSGEGAEGRIYIRPFPSGGGIWRLSEGLAHQPRWSHSGKELYYVAEDQPKKSIVAITVLPDAHGSLQIGTPRVLFALENVREILPQFNAFVYSPHPDGKRFLVNVYDPPMKSTIRVLTKWQSLVNRNVNEAK